MAEELRGLSREMTAKWNMEERPANMSNRYQAITSATEWCEALKSI